ncbi:hypothetical protein Fcan01_01823 [Folsomia candida]|uniref:Uncharacterized protein n=1 Tax=Folsomia candida TaxID=158441 RepID=A0A226EYU7_FOLCA|nr:hypothetical protein Fcan01_01823 [Folsomia candida]
MLWMIWSGCCNCRWSNKQSQSRADNNCTRMSMGETEKRVASWEHYGRRRWISPTQAEKQYAWCQPLPRAPLSKPTEEKRELIIDLLSNNVSHVALRIDLVGGVDSSSPSISNGKGSSSSSYNSSHVNSSTANNSGSGETNNVGTGGVGSNSEPDVGFCLADDTPRETYPSLDDTNGLQTKENVLAAAGGWQKKTARSFRTGMGSRIPLLRHPPSPSSQAAKQGSK